MEYQSYIDMNLSPFLMVLIMAIPAFLFFWCTVIFNRQLAWLIPGHVQRDPTPTEFMLLGALFVALAELVTLNDAVFVTNSTLGSFK